MGDGVFAESDFAWIREWGFDFVRIPMSYLYFVAGPDGRSIDERRLKLIDAAVEYGRKHDVHVSLNFHRAPGYCVTSYPFDTPEPGNLFADEKSLELFTRYWSTLAERYAGIPSTQLSFDLVNEPPFLTDTVTMNDFDRVYGTTLDAIHSADADRLVILEGPDASMSLLPPSLTHRPNVALSTHYSYTPLQISHHRCPWVPDFFYDQADPAWPYDQAGLDADSPYRDLIDRLGLGGTVRWDRDALAKQFAPWLQLADDGVLVHFGEAGAYRETPHAVFLAWLDDLFGVLQDHGIGWALWNFRGPFGVLDSGRSDVAYEDWHGHALDRELLTLLQRR
ncbi:glycoside hydrolase family 5 protein [Dactylosporangium sp. CA-233914]|uniref:glycoside hydrolase family 5 protein n=1 Tax=Dactylosporangium sp. CA-233914 TaxID=3239934 RepID=UPI003D927EFC